MNIVHSIKQEIAALRRLARSVPNDAMAQASIAGQVNALQWVIRRAAPCLLVIMALIMLAGSGAFAQSALTRPPLRPESLAIGGGTKTATAVAGAATLAKAAGVITSESLTTAAGSNYTLTITDSFAAVGDQVFASANLGTSTTGLPIVATAVAGAGTITIVVRNLHATAAFNGTITVAFFTLKN